MAIGNTKIDDLLRRTRNLNESVAWLGAFDGITRKQIIYWIQQDQLIDQGINKDGDIIGYYSELTEIISKGRKQAGDPYTLFDTGDFFKTFFVNVFLNEISINANPIKGDDNLFEKYGDEIIGLTDENFTKLKELVKTKYQEYVYKTLFGNR